MKKFTRGAVAVAAGTTALNAVGYADMALRGRPASSVPARVTEQLARHVGSAVPGNDAARQNHVDRRPGNRSREPPVHAPGRGKGAQRHGSIPFDHPGAPCADRTTGIPGSSWLHLRVLG